MRNKNIYSSIVAAVNSWGNEKELTKGEAINLLQNCVSEGISSFKYRKSEKECVKEKTFGLAISESGLDRAEIQIILEIKENGASTFSKQKIHDLVEENLLNFKIDYIDLLIFAGSFTSEVKEAVNQLKSQEKIREFGFSEVKNGKNLQIAEEFQALEMEFGDFFRSKKKLNIEAQKVDIFIKDFGENLREDIFSSKANGILSEMALKHQINEYQLLLAWIFKCSQQVHFIIEGTNETKWNKSVAAKDINLSEADFSKMKKALKIDKINE